MTAIAGAALSAALGVGDVFSRQFERGNAPGLRVLTAPTKPRRYKGSKEAKRGARLAKMREKAAGRPGRARKRQWAEAHGLARKWYARWEAGLPVKFSYVEAADHRPGGVYPRACNLLIKRLGPAYAWKGRPESNHVQLQGPPCARRPLPTYPVA